MWVDYINEFCLEIYMQKTIQKWQVSLIGIQDGQKTRYKVTGKITGLFAMDKLFYTKEAAINQFEEWLRC